MSISPFSPVASAKTEVRFFGPLDPYHYSVDNRPLQDLDTNFSTFGAATDSARRSSIIHKIAENNILGQMFGLASNQIGAIGLNSTTASDGTTTVGTGAILVSQAYYTGSTQSGFKAGMLMDPVTFNTTPPGSAGQEVQYLIQVKYSDLAGSNSYPYWDSTNIFLKDDLQTGVVSITLKQGTAAAVGTSVVPTPDAGYTGLYAVKAIFGQSTPTCTPAANSPVFLTPLTNSGRFYRSFPVYLSTGTMTTLGVIRGAQLPDGGTDTSATTIVDDTTKNYHPSLPLIVEITGAGDATGNIRFKFEYAPLVAETTNIVNPPWVTLSEVVYSVPSANTYGRIAAMANLPMTLMGSTAFAMRITRMSSDGTDTNTGNFVVDKIIIHQ